ncbi:MAG: YabP/YqfC family sporulation protein [Acutalibacteraceae bacterium]
MKKKSSFQKAKKLLSDWNKSPLADMLSSTRIEFKSNKEVVVEGCKSIDQYDENMIKIKVAKMAILFFGRNLELKCMTSDSLVIYGFITSVEFVT